MQQRKMNTSMPAAPSIIKFLNYKELPISKIFTQIPNWNPKYSFSL